MATRIFTGLLLTAIFLGIDLFAPIWGLQAFLGFAGVLAASELCRLGGRGVRTTDQWVAVIAVLVLLLGSAFGLPALPVFAGLSGMILLYVLFTYKPMDTAGQRAVSVLATTAYIGVFFSAFMRLAAVPHDKGRYLVLIAAAVAFLGDTAAYFGGKAMGRHKLWPAVSPKKTWEGSFSGILGSILGALAVKWLFDTGFGYVGLIVFAIIGGALGQMGDLVESVFKRSAGVKDSGTLLPGHGGVYDRVDAFMFTGAALYLWWTLIGWL